MLWCEVKRLLREAGVSFGSYATQFEGPPDWCVDFGDTVLVLSSSYKELESLRALGKVVIPIESMRASYVGAFLRSNEDARLVASAIRQSNDAGDWQEGPRV